MMTESPQKHIIAIREQWIAACLWSERRPRNADGRMTAFRRRIERCTFQPLMLGICCPIDLQIQPSTLPSEGRILSLFFDVVHITTDHTVSVSLDFFWRVEAIDAFIFFQPNHAELVLSSPDWDRPQEPGSDADGTSTKPKPLLLIHQKNTHREQRLIRRRPPSPRNHHSSGCWWRGSSPDWTPAYTSNMKVQYVRLHPADWIHEEVCSGPACSSRVCGVVPKILRLFLEGFSTFPNSLFLFLMWSVLRGTHPQMNVIFIYFFVYSYFAAIDVWISFFCVCIWKALMDDGQRKCWNWHISRLQLISEISLLSISFIPHSCASFKKTEKHLCFVFTHSAILSCFGSVVRSEKKMYYWFFIKRNAWFYFYFFMSHKKCSKWFLNTCAHFLLHEWPRSLVEIESALLLGSYCHLRCVSNGILCFSVQVLRCFSSEKQWKGNVLT